MGSLSGEAFTAADQCHAHDRLHRRLADERDRLVGDGLPDGDVWVEERGVARRDDDVGVGHEVQAAAGAHAVHRGDHRLPHAAVPRGDAQLGVARAARVLAHLGLVAGDLHDIEAGRERLAVRRVDDDADLGVGVELGPGLLELVEHHRVERVAGVGAVEDEPPDVALPLDDQPFVLHDLGTLLHGSPCHWSGSRGRPSTFSPRMFLFTSVVPPSIELARLRSMPRTSRGSASL